MAESTGGAIASAAVQTLGNYAITAAANKRQFKYQKEAMALQDQYNRDLWEHQNAYNTPQAQMERLKAAGLNPYLVYGGGSANTGNAAPIQPLDVPTQRAATTQLPDLMARHLDARQRDMQYAATQANIDAVRKRAALTEVQTGLENLKLMREGLKSKNYAYLTEAEKKTAGFIALRMEELFNNERSKGNLLDQSFNFRSKSNNLTLASQAQGLDEKSLDIAFKQNRNELAKFGIYQTDHPAFRTLIQASKRMGIDLGELLMKGYDKLQYLFN